MVFDMGHNQVFYIHRKRACGYRVDAVAVKEGVCLYQSVSGQVGDLKGAVGDIYIAYDAFQTAESLNQKDSLFTGRLQLDVFFAGGQSAAAFKTLSQILLDRKSVV